MIVPFAGGALPLLKDPLTMDIIDNHHWVSLRDVFSSLE